MMTADEILEHVRALPERERQPVVELVVHDVAAAEEFKQFQETSRAPS